MFIEPDSLPTKPKVFTSQFLNHVVDESIKNGIVPPDHKFVLIAATNEFGVQAMVGVKRNDLLGGMLELNFIAEHVWAGDNTIGAKVIFSHP